MLPVDETQVRDVIDQVRVEVSGVRVEAYDLRDPVSA
jgi:hypothetical protein